MPSGTTAKQMYRPAARSRCAHAMNRSKPSTVVGGGEMNRATSSVVSSSSNALASDVRSSRSVTAPFVSTGKTCRQSLVTHGRAPGATLSRALGRSTTASWCKFVSMLLVPLSLLSGETRRDTHGRARRGPVTAALRSFDLSDYFVVTYGYKPGKGCAHVRREPGPEQNMQLCNSAGKSELSCRK